MDSKVLVRSGALWSKLLCGAALTLGFASSAHSMDLRTAIEIALETNPEIGQSAANRRAIDFEYQQAKELGLPNVILEGRAGPEWVDSRTTRVLGNDDEILFGRQASVTFQQNLYSFGRHDAEQDRQASRVDAAAHRVWERTEFVSLDVIQAYFDIMRLREILDYGDQNVAFHQEISGDLTRGVDDGITRSTDSKQARERLAAALVDLNESEESHDIAEAKFLQLVGQEVGRTVSPPSVDHHIPTTLEGALGAARRHNPTIKIAYADLDVALAEYRAAKAETKPELLFEVTGRTGEDINGFEDTQHDLRAQVVFRYEFRGGIHHSATQEHLNWADEARQRLMTIERNVEKLVRDAWITRMKTKMRVEDLRAQVAEGVQLRDDYRREFGLGNRTLLDILDSQASLFQAQSALTTAEHADRYAQYRLLASTGQLLDIFDLEPLREAKATLREIEDVPPTPVAETQKRRNPRHFDKAMNMTEWSSTSGRRIAGRDTSPVILAAKPEPVEAKAEPAVEIAEAAPEAVTYAEPAVEVAEAAPEAVTYAEPAVEVAEAAPETVTYAEPVVTYEVEPVQEAVIVEPTSVTIQPAIAPEPAPVVAVTAEPAVVIVAETKPVVEEAAIAAPVEDTMPTTLAVPVVDVEVAEVAPVLSAPAVASDDEALPVGVPVMTASLTEYNELSQRSGAVVYPSLNAVLVDNSLYLLDE